MWLGWDGNPDNEHFAHPETRTISDDYDKFLANNLAASRILSDNRADFLHLIVSGSKPHPDKEGLITCGIIKGDLANPPRYGVTARGRNCRYTLAHELGHNMGLAHDRHVADPDNPPIRPYGYGYINRRAFDTGAPTDKRWRTIMSYDDECQDRLKAGCELLLRFSNYEQTYQPKGAPEADPLGSEVASAIHSLYDTRNIWTRRYDSGCSEAHLTPVVFPTREVWELQGRWHTGCSERLNAGRYALYIAFEVTRSTTIAYLASGFSGGGSSEIRRGISHNGPNVEGDGYGPVYYYDLSPGYYTIYVASAQCCPPVTLKIWQYGPDLIIPSLTVPSPLVRGQSFNARVTIRNSGERVAWSEAKKIDFQYRRHTTGDWNTDTYLTIYNSFGPGESYTLDHTLTAPSAPGEYEYRACVDAVSDEVNAHNNCSRSVRITVRNPWPDLAVIATISDTTLTAGHFFRFLIGVRNLGSAASGAVELRYYRRPTGGALTSIGSDRVPSLASGADSAHAIELTAPAQPGQYEYLACAETTAGEFLTDNNCSSPIRVTVSWDTSRERAMLGLLYGATGGFHWTNNRNWLSREPLSTWHGVAVDSTTGGVTHLRLQNNGLSGRLPIGLSALTSLTHLWLNDNDLTGSIPGDLGELANLGHLSLDTNRRLQGPVPPSFANLRNLWTLRLEETALSGPLPQGLTNLRNLGHLNMGESSLCVPDNDEFRTWVGSLSFFGGEFCGAADRAVLETLYHATGGPNWTVDTNWLSEAPISDWAGVVTDSDGRVVRLDLDTNRNGELIGSGYGNNLVGPIPVELGRLTGLVGLLLGNNRLSGPIPAGLGRLVNVEVFQLDGNRLSGPIPAELANLTKVTQLGLDSRTGLCLAADFPLDSQFARLAMARGVPRCSVDAPDLVVESPAASSAVLAVGESFTLSAAVRNRGSARAGATRMRVYRSTDGVISAGADLEVGSSQVGSLAAGGARLESVVVNAPPIPGSYYYGACVDSVTDESDDSNNCSRGVSVTVSDPGVAADRRVLEALYDATGGAGWRDSTNWKTPEALGEWHGVGTDGNGRVRGLGLVSNQLSGPIPVELGDLSSLDFLDLSFNQLSGPIPPELGSLANLTDLWLGDNRLSGPIPPELGRLPNLVNLYLYTNQLSGRVPPELGNLANLGELYLNDNAALTGPLPESLTRLSRLWLLDISNSALCAPADAAFQAWLEAVDFEGDTCAAPEPVGTIPAQTLREGGGVAAVDVGAYFRDPNGDPLTYTAVSSDSRIATAAVSGTAVALTPLAPGTTAVTVTARDPADLRATQTIAVTVLARNRPPEPAGALVSLTIGVGEAPVTVEVAGAFRDPDGDALTYGARSSRPSVASVSVSGSGVRVAPLSAGTTTVTVTATDVAGSNTTATQTFRVTVTQPFTDDPVVPGVTQVKAVHFTELRTRIDTVRTAVGLGRFSWTDSQLAAGITPIRGVHMSELRTRARAGVRRGGLDDWLQHRADTGRLGDPCLAHQRVAARGRDPGEVVIRVGPTHGNVPEAVDLM